MSSKKKKYSPGKGGSDKARKFTIFGKDQVHNSSKPLVASAGKVKSVSTEEDYYYSDDFDENQDNSPEKNSMYFIGTSIDDLIHPLDEFSNQVHDGNHDGFMDEDLYESNFDEDSLPTSPIKYIDPSAGKNSSHYNDTEEELDKELRQLSSVTFGEEDSEIPYEPLNSSNNGQRGESPPHRTSSQQTVKRVFTAPKHRMIVTPARSVTSANLSSGRAQSQPDSTSQKGNTRIPRPPRAAERSSTKAVKPGVQYHRVKVGAPPASEVTAGIKNDQSLPTVGDVSKSIASSNVSGSKATLPTKGGSSTVVTAKYGASDQGSVFHAQQKWRESELQRQLQVAVKRADDYRRINEELREKLDSSKIQLTIDQLRFELSAKNNRVKELQKENQDLKFLSRYQQKELVDQDLKSTYDAKMSQEKYIELLSSHISKLRQRLQDCKTSEERHIEDWEASQITIKKLRGKVTKLKKTVDNQKEEITKLKSAATVATDGGTDTKAIEIAHNNVVTANDQDNQSVSHMSIDNMSSMLHEESSLASHLADYVGSKVERRYLTQIQILKKDLEVARHEVTEAQTMQKKLEQELERRELVVKRQNYDLRDLKIKYEELVVQYKQLFHGCEMFMGDSTVRTIKKQPPKPPKTPPAPVVEEVVIPIPIIPIVEPPAAKVMTKAALLVGDEEEDYEVVDSQFVEVLLTEPAAAAPFAEPPSSFFLTGDEVPADSLAST